MDLFTLRRRLSNLSDRSPYGAVPATVGGDGDDAKADRVNDLIKKVNARKPTKNRWGGQDYPIDVSDYGQYLAALQSLSWVLRDMGYDAVWLTRGGLSYDNNQYYGYPALFDKSQQKIVALVAVGNAGKCYRFTRDGKQLRIRSFSSLARALAPCNDGDPSGTKAINPAMVKQLVQVMKTQSNLDPEDSTSLRRWGRVIQNKSLKPVGGGVLKSQIKIEFKKAN
jgi:hypothetical protein